MIEDARRKRLARAAHREGLASTGEEVRAPIAGKVVKVLVAAGDGSRSGRAWSWSRR